jgi:hypothetical protein
VFKNEELWIMTKGAVACVSAVECGELQRPKCVNFFGKDFAPEVKLSFAVKG